MITFSEANLGEEKFLQTAPVLQILEKISYVSMDMHLKRTFAEP